MSLETSRDLQNLRSNSNRSLRSIYCFHGSPGVPEEFEPIQEYLKDVKIINPPREGYPGSKSYHLGRPVQKITLHQGTVLMGYSWGAVPCLLEARQNLDLIDGVILVSPYLFPLGKPNPIKNALISTPILGSAILRKMGSEMIDQMLVQSSSPNQVPLKYTKVKSKLSHPRALQMAVLEKKRADHEIREAFKYLSAADIPLAVIWGGEDQTSREIDQIEPIRYWISILHEKKIPEGGHALLWTHPEEVAEAIQDFLTKADLK